MCGIFLSEECPSDETLHLISNRGLDSICKVVYNDLHLVSSVLNIRSCISQPIISKNFAFQYNGEIYNEENSDTLYISNLLSECLGDIKISNTEECFDFIIHFHDKINKNENEMAIVITTGQYICFCKDDVGRKSLGYSINPFTVSSVVYKYELDPMKVYIYDTVNKRLESRFKLFVNLIEVYMNGYINIVDFVESDKYKEEMAYLSGYKMINNESRTNQSIIERSTFNIKTGEFHISNTENTVHHLDRLLLQSFTRRMYANSPVIFLSGGIDSLITAIYAHLTHKSEEVIYLINTAVPSSFDREMGLLAYKDLKEAYPARKFIFIENDLNITIIQQHKSEIVKLMAPKKSKMDFNIATVLFFSAKEANKYSKVAYLGSGADEVFGGYNKYKTDKNRFRDHMFFDLFTISSHNLCRDDRVISNWNIEARFPLLDTDIIKWTFSLPDSCLINESHNKKILRDLLKFHNFTRAADIPKKAMQYGTGMHSFEKQVFCDE